MVVLTWRQRDVLECLDAQRWLRPMAVGGRDASHHSATLAALVRKGLAERKHRGASTAWLYRITPTGEAARRKARNQQIEGDAR